MDYPDAQTYALASDRDLDSAGPAEDRPAADVCAIIIPPCAGASTSTASTEASPAAPPAWHSRAWPRLPTVSAVSQPASRLFFVAVLAIGVFVVGLLPLVAHALDARAGYS